MLLGSVVGQDVEEWERMIEINQNGLLFMTKAALPHLLAAAEDDLAASRTSSTSPRSPADRHGQLRRLQHDEVRGERLHRSAPPGNHQEARPSRRARARRRRDRTDLAQQRHGQGRSWPSRTPRTSPRSCSRRTSPRASPTWSPAPAAPPSPNCGRCPPHRPDPHRTEGHT